MEKSLSKFCEKYQELEESNCEFVVVTLTGIKGSAPQNIGARMIVSKSEILFGTVGGGKVENKCLEVAREILISNESTKSYSWNLQKDIGMTCGGEVSFLFESTGIQKRWNIAIFGAGHISQALTRLLLNLNCHLTVVDNRSEWLAKLPKSDKLEICQRESMETVVAELPSNSYIVIVTMGHAYDTPILEQALSKNIPFPFLGVIGSKPKRNRIESELIERGIRQSSLKKFYCPMGENIGNNSPPEIAISITSQLLRIRDNSPL